VHGVFIDLVNLRSEKYTEDSRVPVIDIGTPEEDAFRRDLTINSMFYNINEDKVEDYTKLGETDLKEGIVRTPLEPLKTFLDDPLRVLRTVRFATRFDFRIAPEILPAAHDPRVIVSSGYLIT
jgi:tRNA nucleotidyltransferase (CCA-adding enzyme)